MRPLRNDLHVVTRKITTKFGYAREGCVRETRYATVTVQTVEITGQSVPRSCLLSVGVYVDAHVSEQRSLYGSNFVSWVTTNWLLAISNGRDIRS